MRLFSPVKQNPNVCGENHERLCIFLRIKSGRAFLIALQKAFRGEAASAAAAAASAENVRRRRVGDTLELDIEWM